jgi:hypothetical protein
MKNLILFILIIAILLVGLFLWKGKKSPATGALATIQGDTTEASITGPIPAYDFGLVSMAKGNVEHDFAITNTTDSDITINQAETSCMCTEAFLKLPGGKEMGPYGMPGHGSSFSRSVGAVIKPGEVIFVKVIFNPAAHGPAGIGKIERIVTLSSGRGPLTMQFRAEVTP